MLRNRILTYTSSQMSHHSSLYLTLVHSFSFLFPSYNFFSVLFLCVIFSSTHAEQSSQMFELTNKSTGKVEILDSNMKFLTLCSSAHA